jgi:methionyl-tRNA synthetase
LPESNDSDLSDDEIVRRVNQELVATWGNLVNRVVAMTNRFFGGVVPKPGDLNDADTEALESSQMALDEVAENLAAVKIRAGIVRAMQMAGDANVYLSDLAPWTTAKTNMERTGTTLWVAHQLIAAAAVALAPYLPVTSVRVLDAQGIESPDSGPVWEVPVVVEGTHVSGLGPLFAKVELDPED